MAGSIIISPGKGVAFNSRGFNLVVELIRDVLKVNDPDLIECVYESMDFGCMPFISVEALGESDARRFYLATTKAFAEWRRHNSEPFPEWSELIEKLEADERLNDA